MYKDQCMNLSIYERRFMIDRFVKQKNTEKEEDFTLSDLDLDDETFQNLLKKDISSDGSYKMKK